jgi:hypothetical protein
MSESHELSGLVARIADLHESLDSMHVRHQFGGAIALAWYRNPRATTDIDVNITIAPERANPVLGALRYLGVSVTDADRATIRADGQARLEWGDSLLDVFFATLPLHEEMASRARTVELAGKEIPILSPEDLVICKAVFDRPKDWVDIEAMFAWGTDLDVMLIDRWIVEILGPGSPAQKRLEALASGRKD